MSRTPDGPDAYVLRPGNAGYAVEHYDLDLDYRVATNRLAGVATLRLRTVVDLDRFSLDLVGLTLGKVRVAGEKMQRYSHRGGKVAVVLAATVAAGRVLEVEVRYSGTPRPVRGHWGEVGWEELTDGVVVASQPDGAPSWFPCNDHPADKASYRITVETDSDYTVVANGALLERRVGGSRTRWVHDQPEPIPTYLATVGIGRYDVVETAAGPVPQRVVFPARLRERVLHDLARQAQMLGLFTELFGPYPFGSYAALVTDDDLEIPVEAAGMSIFGANHVDGDRGSERLVAHELAHQWFGNSVTAAGWQHLWLHEGFACYAEWVWAESAGGEIAQQRAVRAHARLAELPQDLVIGDPGPELMFDDRLYQRGALTLHALRCELGDDRFFGLLRAWTAAFRHASASTADFVSLAQSHAGRPLDAFFARWLDAAALPPLTAGSR